MYPNGYVPPQPENRQGGRTGRRSDRYAAPQRVAQAAQELNSRQQTDYISPDYPVNPAAQQVSGYQGNGMNPMPGGQMPGQWQTGPYQNMNQGYPVSGGVQYAAGAGMGYNIPDQRPNIGAQAGQPQQPGQPANAWQRGYQPQNGRPVMSGTASGQPYGGGYIPPARGNRAQTQTRSSGGGKGGKGKRSPWGRIALAAALVVVVALGVVIAVRSHEEQARREETAAIVTPYNGVYCPGVYVDGISLAGMTPEQAWNTVTGQITQRYGAWSVRLTYQGELLYEFTADQLGMTPQVENALNDAWKQGHTDLYGNALTEEERRAAMEQLQTAPFLAYTAEPDRDTTVIDRVLEEIRQRIDRPAQDAAVLAFNPEDTYPFSFQDEVTGLRLDTEPLREQIYQAAVSLESMAIELQPQEIRPNVTTADLKVNYTLRGSATTPISKHSTEDRNNNIRRAFQSVSGYILQPGKQFSFNTVVGQRTVENGFFKAVEYAYGEHVEGVGGGVCQASTTIYQAAVAAGLEIVKREPHSDAVSYTDYGKDATVYWVGKRKIDFVFKNNTDAPVYLVAAVASDPSNKNRLIAKVSIYGQDMGDVRYELQSETIEILEPPEEPEYVKDKKAEYVKYTDQKKSVSKAQKGYVVESYRVKYEGGTMVEKRLMYTDRYEPKAEKIYVGVSKRQ